MHQAFVDVALLSIIRPLQHFSHAFCSFVHHVLLQPSLLAYAWLHCPVWQECVSQVYTLLVSAARDAAAVAGEHTEAAMNGKVPLIVPEFKTFIMPAVIRALDEWRAEGEKSEQGCGSTHMRLHMQLCLSSTEPKHGLFLSY